MSSASILLVEDNIVLRDGLQLLLESDGFEVHTADNGLEALQMMKSGNCPDLILSDIAMPEMDGMAFLSAVRSRADWIAIPFIFLTARGTRDEVFVGKGLGIEDYLVKPVNNHELLSTIRARLVRSQQLMFAELAESYQSSLIMLANAIELRDHYTRGHVERVMQYSWVLAHAIGFTTEELHHLKYGSILHDVGKIHIRESILRKPGPLDDTEWQEMRHHPKLGAALIQNIDYLKQALPIILHHHERWDGNGYPDGLAGEAIPIEARIVAVADSLDAMTTTRAYKPALTKQQAFEEIVSGSGSRYDPSVVAVFKRIWDQIQSFIPEATEYPEFDA